VHIPEPARTITRSGEQARGASRPSRTPVAMPRMRVRMRSFRAFLMCCMFATSGFCQTMTYGGNNTVAWVQRLNIRMMRGGCRSGLRSAESCVTGNLRDAQRQGLVRLFVATFNDPRTAAPLATEYSDVSLRYRDVEEVGVDDFLSTYYHWDLYGKNPLGLLNDIITNLKSRNTSLRFGITLYSDEFTTPYIDATHPQHAEYDGRRIDAATRARIDYVHLYSHFRVDGLSYPAAVEKTRALFPNAKIIAGSYAYDRIDYTTCASGTDRCSVSDELSYFEIEFRTQVQLLKLGSINAVEFYPAYFGNEASYPHFACKADRRGECVANTKRMRETAARIWASEMSAGRKCEVGSPCENTSQ
jgi:hypothetical protein